jgi:hypothetical protein
VYLFNRLRTGRRPDAFIRFVSEWKFRHHNNSNGNSDVNGFLASLGMTKFIGVLDFIVSGTLVFRKFRATAPESHSPFVISSEARNPLADVVRLRMLEAVAS